MDASKVDDSTVNSRGVIHNSKRNSEQHGGVVGQATKMKLDPF